MSTRPGLERLRQKDADLEANLNYIIKTCQKKEERQGGLPS